MEKILNRLKEPLKIEEVDFRVQSINTGGYATIIPYKDARVDMNRLDDVCGTNWQDKYELIDGQLFCSIGIKIENEWIWRQDVGVESNTEKQKGRASDAFKRAGFRWGIGRELYEYPLIQVKLNPDEFDVKEYQGKKKARATWKLKIKEWKWSVEFKGGKVLKLVGTDQNGKLRYDSSSKTNGSANQQTAQRPTNGTSNQNAAKPSGNSNGTNRDSDQGKPWLNKMSGKDFTREWLNVLKGINTGTITEVKQVKKHYKVSKATEEALNEVLKFQPQKS